ncbi:MAG TPA: DegT/DnrJ/EryC1/StrS family aminotransferase [Terriglobales bacterium]|nr:DegT/DnrJ/EryC1/StrS family aminotransferase [Terriglobales bacterium]
MEFVDLKKQYRGLQNSIDLRVRKVMESAQFIMGPEIAELESALASRVGTRHCISCSSGTDALLLAMMALKIGPGDEVITSPFTFIATGEMIALLGAKPVFVDIDVRTYNLDPALLPAAITSRTRAIMPVSLYGQCADMDRINAIAKAHKLPVIEDAAQSFGATYKRKPSCNLSTIGCTSFFPSKPLGCYGDGGACFTNDDDLATAMRQTRVHGQDRRYHHPRLGLNGRLDTIQAAILLAKLEVFDQELQQRNRIAGSYSQSLKHIAEVPYIESHNVCAWAQYTIQTANRTHVQQALAAKGIPSAVHYPTPIHLQPVFNDLGFSQGAFPISESASERVISLPMHAYLAETEIKSVIVALTEVLDPAAVTPSAVGIR